MLDAALSIAQSNIGVKTTIGSNVVFGIICAVVAPGRGRSAVAWFFLGLVFNFFALIFLVMLPDLNEAAATQAATTKELHRLREQVRQEHLVAAERPAGAGVDTSGPPPAPPPQPPPPSGDQEVVWFFVEEGAQLGPVQTHELRKLRQDARIDGATMVWRDGMSEWMQFGDLRELQ